MSKKEVLAKGWNWRDLDDKGFEGEKYVPAERIGDVEDEVCEKVIVCDRTARPFKIIQSELNLYRRLKVPIPLRHPDERFMDRMNLRNPRSLRETLCGKCGVKVETTFSEGSVKNIYCEKCYNAVVYG